MDSLSRRDFLKLSAVGAASLASVWLPKILPRGSIKETEPSYELTFNDEFNGNEVDVKKWVDHLVPYAGNNEGRTHGDKELQFYAPLSEGYHILSDGVLKLKADKRILNSDYLYTSAMISSKDKFKQKFGYFEMKAKFPEGVGFWPAFWLLPDAEEGQPWPPEIDITEFLGENPNTLHFANHMSANYPSIGGPEGGYDNFDFKDIETDYTKKFHTFGLLWEPDKLSWFVDGDKKYESTEKIPQHPMYIIVNLAVGGWAKPPDENTNFPSYLEVDHIKVWALKNVQEDLTRD